MMATTTPFAAKAGRPRGAPNTPPRERMRKERQKLERLLLEKALAGDVPAILACLRIDDEVVTAEEAPTTG